MKVNKSLKDKRKKEIEKIYNAVLENEEDRKERIYKIVKKITEKNKNKLKDDIINLIFNLLEDELSIVLKEIKKYFSKYYKDNELLLDDLLYNRDGLTLQQRIQYHLDDFKDGDTLILFTALCLILDTETYQIIGQTLIKKIDFEYIEIIGGEGEKCDCGLYCDGEAHSISENYPEPPYHPNCQCQVLIYLAYEIEELI